MLRVSRHEQCRGLDGRRAERTPSDLRIDQVEPLIVELDVVDRSAKVGDGVSRSEVLLDHLGE